MSKVKYVIKPEGYKQELEYKYLDDLVRYVRGLLIARRNIEFTKIVVEPDEDDKHDHKDN